MFNGKDYHLVKDKNEAKVTSYAGGLYRVHTTTVLARTIGIYLIFATNGKDGNSYFSQLGIPYILI